MGTVIVTIIVTLFIAISIGALIIMLATKIAAGFGARFGQAFLAALLATILAGILSWIIQMVLGVGGMASVVSLVLVFLLNSAIINAIVKRPDGLQMGFGKACLVSLIQIVIEIIIGILCVFLFGAAIFGAMSAMH
jgi:hypothetical protein